MDHRTAVTPTLSEAIPEIVIESEDVETMLEPGDVMVNDGGVWSGAPGVGVGVGEGAGDGGGGTGKGCGVGEGCGPAGGCPPGDLLP